MVNWVHPSHNEVNGMIVEPIVFEMQMPKGSGNLVRCSVRLKDRIMFWKELARNSEIFNNNETFKNVDNFKNPETLQNPENRQTSRKSSTLKQILKNPGHLQTIQDMLKPSANLQANQRLL